MKAKDCPKCEGRLLLSRTIHRREGDADVMTSYFRCSGCGYKVEEVERRKMPPETYKEAQ